MKIDFLLNDTIWAKGKVKEDINKVNLWLGANTLVEFSFDEAIALLNKNLENAKGNLKAFVILIYISIIFSIIQFITDVIFIFIKEDDLMYLKD